MPIITITDAPGTLSEEIAERLALKLGIPLLDREKENELFFRDIASPYDLKLLDESPKHYFRNAQNGINFRDNLVHALNQYADTHNAIDIGVVPSLFLAKHPNAIHIRVTAPEDLRKRRLMRVKGNSQEDVAEIIKASDREFKRYGKILFDEESQDEYLYHMTINTGKITVDAAVLMIAEAYRAHLAQEILYDSDAEEEKVMHREEESTLMKNASEIAFAKVLDMYHIRWVYEPKTFQLEYNPDGSIKTAFSPDFYLPTYDLYLELTVMNPKYSSAKRRKVRLIQKLYPDINIKLVEKKDFDHFIRSLNRASTVLLSAKDPVNQKKLKLAAQDEFILTENKHRNTEVEDYD